MTRFVKMPVNYVATVEGAFYITISSSDFPVISSRLEERTLVSDQSEGRAGKNKYDNPPLGDPDKLIRDPEHMFAVIEQSRSIV